MTTTWKNIGDLAFSSSKNKDFSIEALADWVEIQCIIRGRYDDTLLRTDLEQAQWRHPNHLDQVASPEDMDSEVNVDSASRTDEDDETYDDEDETAGDNSDRYYQIAFQTFQRIEAREKDYGLLGYPFALEPNRFAITYTGIRPLVYTFLLAVSYLDPSKPPTPGAATSATIFEQLSCHALSELFSHGVGKYKTNSHRLIHLGNPSITGHADTFNEKINEICKQIREGGGYQSRPSGHVQTSGDNGVDLLLRRGFPDDNGGQFLIYGACAAGKNWKEKLRECNPLNWSLRNFIQGKTMAKDAMAKCFCIPRIPTVDGWDDLRTDAGAVLDRCRLTYLCEDWNSTAAQTWMSQMALALPTPVR